MSASKPPSPSALFHAVGIFSLSISQYVLAFIASAVISRTLGPELRGAYYLPVLAAATLLVVCRLGIDQANVFLFATRGVPLSRLAAQNGLIALTTGLIGCAIALTLPWASPAVFGDTRLLYLLIAGVTVPIGLHSQLSAGLLGLAGRPSWQYRASLAGSCCQVILLLTLMATGNATVLTVLLVSLAMTVTTWLVMMLQLRTFEVIWIRWDRSLLTESLRSSLVLHAAMLLLFLHLRVDMFMVKAWLGNEALGHYSLSVSLAETLMLATDAVALAVLPGQVTNTLAEAGSRALRAARGNLLLGLTVATGWAILATPVTRTVFGVEFLPAVAPMLVLLPGMIMHSMQRMAGPPVLRSGRPSRMVAIYSVSLVFNILLNALCIPRWGLVGAAAASSITYALSTAFFLRWTASIAAVPLLPALVPRASDFDTLRRGARQGVDRLYALFSRATPPPVP